MEDGHGYILTDGHGFPMIPGGTLIIMEDGCGILCTVGSGRRVIDGVRPGLTGFTMMII